MAALSSKIHAILYINFYSDELFTWPEFVDNCILSNLIGDNLLRKVFETGCEVTVKWRKNDGGKWDGMISGRYLCLNSLACYNDIPVELEENEAKHLRLVQ